MPVSLFWANLRVYTVGYYCKPAAGALRHLADGIGAVHNNLLTNFIEMPQKSSTRGVRRSWCTETKPVTSTQPRRPDRRSNLH